MANSYYNGIQDVVNGQTSDADDINDLDTALIAGFDLVEADVDARVVDAAAHSTKASQWAEHPEDTDIPGEPAGTYSSMHHSLKSDAARVLSETAQTASETAQTAAELAETNAETAQTAAELAEANAELAQTNAEVAAINAGIAQTAAEVAETNAETAETNAGLEVVNAQTEVGYASEWANKAEDSLISAAAGGDQVDDYSALHHAAKAAASAATFFPSGTSMIFYQAAAPTGWTEDTIQANSALRVVSVAGAQGGFHGGFEDFSTAFAHLHTTEGHTLTVAEMPAHTHRLRGRSNIVNQPVSVGGQTSIESTQAFITSHPSIESTGSGNSHTHGNTGEANIQPKYMNVIVCTKD